MARHARLADDRFQAYPTVLFLVSGQHFRIFSNFDENSRFSSFQLIYLSVLSEMRIRKPNLDSQIKGKDEDEMGFIFIAFL